MLKNMTLQPRIELFTIKVILSLFSLSMYSLCLNWPIFNYNTIIIYLHVVTLSFEEFEVNLHLYHTHFK